MCVCVGGGGKWKEEGRRMDGGKGGGGGGREWGEGEGVERRRGRESSTH